MKKRIGIIYILALIMVFGLGFNSGILYYKNSSTKSSLNNTISDNNILISYAEYQAFFNYIKEHIKIEGLEMKYASSQDNYHIIDANWSFGTRNRLLLDNKDYLTTSNSDIKDIDASLTQNTNSCMLSYNNLIIGIQQGRKNTDVNYLKESINEIVKVTEDYFIKNSQNKTYD